MNQSHTDLAARCLCLADTVQHVPFGLAELLRECAAALESPTPPERVKVEAAIAHHMALVQAYDMREPSATLEVVEASARSLLAPPTAPAQDARTPQDYAIEHAEYMAQRAEHLIEAVNDLALAEQENDDGTANQSDVDAARETAGEAQTKLREGVYEFRKRRDRALRAALRASTPAERVPLIEAQIEEAYISAYRTLEYHHSTDYFHAGARFAEKAHGIVTADKPHTS